VDDPRVVQLHHRKVSQASYPMARCLSPAGYSILLLDEARILQDLGLILKQQNKITEAKQAWTCALTIFEEIKSPKAEIVRRQLSGM
jgi:hypothetical protein